MIVEFDVELSKSLFRKTISALHKAGKIPIIVGPSPSGDFNIGDCYERKYQRKMILGRENCNFLFEDYRGSEVEIIDALLDVAATADVKIFWPHDVICSAAECTTIIDNIYLYRDRGHFSVNGSKFIVEKMKIIDYLKQIKIIELEI